jgi:hypothetical protein
MRISKKHLAVFCSAVVLLACGGIGNNGVPSATSVEPTPSVTALTHDQGRAVEAAQACMHWGGEEPFNEERAQYIAESSRRDCAKAKRQLAKHVDGIRQDPIGALMLVQYAAHIGGDEAKQLIPEALQAETCIMAESEVVKLKAKGESYFPYFDGFCASP